MDFNRNALILYLRDLRDLEVAKVKIINMYNEEKRYAESQLREMCTPNLEKEDNEVDFGELIKDFGIMLVFGIVGGFFVFSWITQPDVMLEEYHDSPIMTIALTVVPVIVAIGFLFSTIGDIRYEESKNKKAREHNQNERMRVKNNAVKITKVKHDWSQRSAYLRNELNKVESLLAEYYIQNILPNAYRNVAALIYIYDYMSSSNESFKDTLFHEHMENGISKILKKLDQIILQNEHIMFSLHRIEAQSDDMMTQNKNMLESLARTEHNSMEASQYAKLSENYSKTSAYFSVADYLEDKNKQ